MTLTVLKRRAANINRTTSADSCVAGLLSTESKLWANAYILGDDFDVSTVPNDAAIILVRLPNGQTPKGSTN